VSAALGILEAWNRGRLFYKLFAHQKKAYELIDGCFKKGRRRFVLNWSRRLGKTFTALIRCVETCLRKGFSRVLVAAPSGKHLEEFVHPQMRVICSDGPLDKVPRWVEAESAYIFPNGSRIVMAGCDTEKKADLLRGPAADGAVLEEAGSIPTLNYVRRSVIGPQLMPRPDNEVGGWMLIVSSPPPSSGHPFVKMAKDNERLGSYLRLTIWDGQYTREQAIREIEQEADGVPLEEYMESVDFRREFLAEFITDPNKAVLKYASEKNVGSADKPGLVIQRFLALKRPSHFVGYAGQDIGWSPDGTGVLWGYWHFPEQTLVIERELLMRRMTTNELAAEEIRIEKELWGEHRRTPVLHGYEEPRRWSDHDPRLLTDLAADHAIVWAPTPKDDRDAAIDSLNKMIPGYKGKLAVSPECHELLAQLQAAIWNNKRTEFARDDRYLHFDLVAALVYLARNVVRSEDPIPPGYGINGPGRHRVDFPGAGTAEAEKWAKVFGLEGLEA
jgi:hypothetical protein